MALQERVSRCFARVGPRRGQDVPLPEALVAGVPGGQGPGLGHPDGPGLKIEQFSEDGFLFMVAVPLLVLVVAVVLAAMPAELGRHWLLLVVGGLILWRHWRSMLDRGRGLRSRRPLDDLVEFAAVKPHAPALGTIVNLDAAAFRHDQGYVALRAIHEYLRVFCVFR